MSLIPALNPQETADNLIVEVVYREKGRKRCAVGVLLRETETTRRIGFNARNDEVVDYLDIDVKDIVMLRMIEASAVENWS